MVLKSDAMTFAQGATLVCMVGMLPTVMDSGFMSGSAVAEFWSSCPAYASSAWSLVHDSIAAAAPGYVKSPLHVVRLPTDPSYLPQDTK